MAGRRRKRSLPIPVVDLFAGPGGLGEGFASLEQGGIHPFRLVLSVECDPVAHQTLELRAFYRAFSSRGLNPPGEYFRHVRDPRSYSRAALFRDFPNEAAEARFEACLARMGEPAGDTEVDRRIEALRADGLDFSRSVIIGGPPCQAYSLVGRSRMSKARANGQYVETEDGRHVLYKQYLRLLKELKPAAFVMENVRGILSARYSGQPIFPRILADLTRAGYHVHALGTGGEPGNHRPELEESLFESPTKTSRQSQDYLLFAHHHGVPQRRARVIVVGTRSDLDVRSLPPLPILTRPCTVKQAIGDLPKLRSGLSTRDDTSAWKDTIRHAAERLAAKARATEPALAVLLGKIASESSPIGGKAGRGGDFIPIPASADEPPPPLGGVLNHETRGHIPADLERYLFYAAWSRAIGGNAGSPSLADLPRSILPKHQNVQEAASAGTLDEVAFADRFRVQVSNEPATTITSHISKDGHYYIHYDPYQCRSLTVREAARLQTFPDDYLFCGPRTEQYKQVGNAVPPLLAQQVAAVLMRSLT